MKKQLILLLGILLILPSFVSASPSIAERLKGRILLQVESRGEAYYVNPATAERYYMENGDAAYNVMRNLGVGITNANLENIKNNKTLALKQKGKIFLQVESHGEAYYVDFSGNLHYLKDGSEAFNIMRTLGLGITTRDLEQIPSKMLVLNTGSNNSKITDIENTTQKATSTEQITAPTKAPNQDWLDAMAEYEKYYPVIVSLSDDKGNINNKSTCNTYSGVGANQNKNTLMNLKVGDTITLTLTAKDPLNRQLLYAWASNIKCPGVFNLGASPSASDFTTNNKITCNITEDLDIIRIEGYIKSEKIGYRNPSGFDDSISMNYNDLPYHPFLP